MKWKREVLDAIGLTSFSLTARDWILLTLLANSQCPVRGEESLHAIFFMMQYPPFSFKPLLLSVYSQELHQALEELIEKGFVRREYSNEKGRTVELLTLTEKGLIEASRIAEKMRGSWITIGDIVVREGSKVLSELEALKKTYNGRDTIELMKLFLDRIDNPESTFDMWFTREEIEFMKKVHRYFRRTI